MEPSPEPAAPSRLPPVIRWTVVAALGVLYLVPIWGARYLPVLDLPVHYQMTSVVAHLHDSKYAFDNYFDLRDGMLPYWTLYAVGGGLARVMGIDAAMKVMLSLVALALLGGVGLGLRAFGRSPWLVVLALPFVYDVNATYGYLAFRLSVGLGLLCVALLRLDLRAPRLWREGLLAVAAVATFFTHAHGFSLMVLWCAVTLVFCAPGLRPALRGAVAGLPALCVAAPWFYRALLGGPAGGNVHAPHLPVIKLMELAGHRALNSFAGNADEVVAIGLLLCWLGLVLASPRPGGGSLRERLAGHTPEVLAALVLVGYFAVPNAIVSPTTRIYGINYRFLLPLGLLLCWVPRVRLSGLRALALFPLLAVVGFYGVRVAREYVDFSNKYKDFDKVVAAMKPKARVVTWLFETRDPRLTVPMLGHFVGYYHARKGGVPSNGHTFATYSYMPVKLRDEAAHPEPNYRGVTDWPRLMERYDYVLVTDHPGSKRTPFDAARAELVAEGGPFRVYTWKR